MLQKALEGFGKLWEALGRLWEALKYFRMLWEALGATVKICKALDGLEGFGGFRNAFGGFGKL